MIQPFETGHRGERALSVSMRLDQVLMLALLVLIFGVRVVNLQYNTLFVDEAIYATVGRDVLAGSSSHSALGWMYGSYLYPALAGAVNELGGVVGLRLMSALLSTLAAALVYLATARLFGGEAAVWAALIFGFTAISIDTGQYAVYDAPVIPALAGALYLVVRAAEAPPRLERFGLYAAGACMVVAVLTKYFAALFLPALCCVGLACALHQGRSLRPFLLRFLLPLSLIIGAYGLFTLPSLLNLLAGEYAVRPGARSLILREIWAEIGATTLLALAGLGLLAWRGLPMAADAPRWRRRLWMALVPALALSALAAPLYHLAAGNAQSAWKHSVYSLIFLAPLAGYTCLRVVNATRELNGRWSALARVVGAAASVACVVWGLNYVMNRNWGFQHSWPNVTGVVAHLRESGLEPGDRVLAEGAQIYDYYFDFGPGQSAMWSNTWYGSYKGLAGSDAMEAAIADRFFRFVVLDSYHTPELRDQLEGALSAAGYTRTYDERQPLSLGREARLSVYATTTP